MKYIKDIPVLTRTEEIDLFEKIKKGNKDAKNEVIKHNLRLVISVVKHYNFDKEEFENLIQEGNLSLIKAVDNFDIKKGNKFSTFATSYIKGGILNYLNAKTRMIKLPREKMYQLIQYKKIKKNLYQEYNKEPSKMKIAKEMNISVEKVKELETFIDTISLDQTILKNEGENKTIIDLLADKTLIAIDDNIVEKEKNNEIKKIIETKLNKTEKDIIVRYYGLENKVPCTLQSLGLEYGLTRERIRQIKNIAERKIKNNYKRYKRV